MPIHSLPLNPQPVTGSVSLSEVAAVTGSVVVGGQVDALLVSGSVTGLLVGGQPLNAANPVPVSVVAGTINVTSTDDDAGLISGSLTAASASLAGFLDPAGLVQLAHVDNFGNLIVTGSVAVSNFPAVQVVTGSVVVDNVVNVTGSVGVSGPISVTGPVLVSGSVVATQGTTPWIISGSDWSPTVVVSNTVTVTGSVGISGPIAVSNFPAVQVVTGSVNVHDLSTSAVVSFVSASASTSVELVPASSARLGLTIYNDTSKLLYVKLGMSASLNDYTTQLAKDDYYEIPFGYQGRIDAFSPATVTGVVRITEIL